MILNKKTKNKTNNNSLLISILINMNTTNIYDIQTKKDHSRTVKQANIYYRKGSVKSWTF